ncbi:MAG TPA: ATP-binding protein [Cyclobacteriaceae bacterium]|nr:ATP-binding protein [Cyclobacteriaceae bacterium]
MNQKPMIQQAMAVAILLSLICVASIRAQSPHVIDSLERNLKIYSADKRSEALFTLVSYYQRSDQEKTKVYRDQSFSLLKAKDKKAQIYALATEGVYKSGVGMLDSAAYWFYQARDAAKLANDGVALRVIYSGLGKCLVAAGKAEAAVSNLLEGLRLADKDANQETAMKMRINLTWAYLELKRYRDGIKLGLHTLNRMDSSLQWMALYLYNNIAICYGAVGQLDSARYFVGRAITAAEAVQNYGSLANAHFILGTIYSNAGKDNLAIEEYEKGLPYRAKVGDPVFMASDLYTLSALYEKTGNYARGLKTGLEALDIARKHNLLLKFQNTYEVLAKNYEGLKDFRNASKYYELWAAAKDSIYQNANAQAIADMEAKYETEKKEQQIALQNATIATQEANIQRNYILNAALAVVILLVIVILLLVRSRLRRKQEALKKEYELSVREAYISATIQSQESERKRFAQDLHDGMGQLISALRFTITPGNPDASEDKRLDRMIKAESILNDMHKEIRGVAYNLMPQMLIRGGLIPAIQEMSLRVNSTSQVKLSVNSFDVPDRFPEIHEISLYRVVQEWVNNVLKYSSAQNVQVQLVGHADEITLTIEDDGMGFDRSKLEHSAGNGWKNIQSRLSLIKATVEVDTQPGRRGTTLIVSLPRQQPGM